MGLDKSFNPILRFAVISDIHYKDEMSCERERFADAIKYAYEIAEGSDTYKRLDALYIVGDFSNSGSEKQMRAVKKTLDENLRDETELTITLASHEYKQPDGEMGALARFTDIFNMPYNTHKVINGFDFIALTTVNGCHFEEPQKDFAKKELDDAASSPSKPIFFFQHPHITDTVYGSINWGEDELTSILMNYPQIIDFSGHSHAPINDPRSIHQKYFTSLGTGTLSYFELDEFDKLSGTVPENSRNAAQMLIVEADASNRVRVYPIDVLTRHFFPMTWEIDEPSNPQSFIYTDERYKTTATPYFDSDAECVAKEITEDSAVLTFSQAKPNDGDKYVNCYIIVVRDSDGVIKKQLSVWSGYYFYDMPLQVTQKIDGLSAKTEYSAEIYPAGFWKNVSKTPLKFKFKTT